MEDFNSFTRELSVIVINKDKLNFETKEFLNKEFLKLSIFNDEYSALEEFKEYDYDIVLSFSNECCNLLEQVRKINKNIPIILVSEKFDTNFLIKITKLHINEFLFEPLDLNILKEKIDAVSKELYNTYSLKKQKNELISLFQVINDETQITRTDPNGIITYVNDTFCEISGYTKEELIGQSHNIVRHPDVPCALFEEMWKTIQKGNQWEGVIKNKAKDGSSFHLNTKIFPVFDTFGENIIEFISIRFAVTDEIIKNRENKKAFLEQIAKHRINTGILEKSHENLKSEIESLNQNMQKLSEINDSNKKKIKFLLDQIDSYEYSQLKIIESQNNRIADKNKQFHEVYESLVKTKTQKSKLAITVKNLEKLSDSQSRQIKYYENELNNKDKRIKDLLDLVNDFQKEMELKEAV